MLLERTKERQGTRWVRQETRWVKQETFDLLECNLAKSERRTSEKQATNFGGSSETFLDSSATNSVEKSGTFEGLSESNFCCTLEKQVN